MVENTRRLSGRSAEVRIHLTVNGHVFSVAQLGPDFLVLRDALDRPPGPAELAMSIDGDFKQWAVDLVEGISLARRKTRICYLPADTSSPVR